MNTAGSVLVFKCEASYEWKIRDYITLVNGLSGNSCIISPKFPFSNSTWCIRLFPKYVKGYTGIFLEKKDSAVDEKSVKFSFSIMSSTGLTNEFQGSHTFSADAGLIWGIPEFIKIDEKNKQMFVPHEALSVIFSIKEAVPYRVNDSPSLLKLLDLEHLSSHFEALYIDKIKCDVTVKVDDREFQTHKSVLVARSPVLKAMFEHDSEEEKLGIITIRDCDSESFGHFLKFLYTGSLEDISFEISHSLYITADKYDVPCLKSFCCTYMIDHITVENMCDAATLADKYDDSELMEEVQSYFNRNAYDVVLTDQWKKLTQTNYDLVRNMLKEKLKI